MGDDRLVAAVRAGDDAAFEAIYDRYYLGLLAFCRHMLGGRHEAEDALQHSFASAYRAMRGGDAVIELRPWLYTIARNRCLSALRAYREEVEVDGGHLDRGSLDGLGDQIQRRAELRELVDDLQRLREDQRAALVLFELGDHSHEEIAAVLGVRREKVKALVFQARAGLLRAREARDASCVEVREQLASVTGALPARGMARAHVERCPGCAAFEDDVRRQRRALAAILPVVPTMGLKASVLGFALGGGGGAALTGAGGGATIAAGGALAAGGAGGAGAAGGGGAVGLAGALGTAGAATVAGGLATGSANVATGVAGATAKGLVAKILAVVAVAGGTGDVRQSVSEIPLIPVVTASATPALVGKAPRSGADTPSHDPVTGLAHGVPAPASQAAPADPVMPAAAPAPSPTPADPVPTAAPAPAPAQVAPQPSPAPPPAPAAADSEPTPAPVPAADPEPAATTPEASTPATETSTSTPSTPSAAGTPSAPSPSATINATADGTVTTMSTPEPPPAPSAGSAQAQE